MDGSGRPPPDVGCVMEPVETFARSQGGGGRNLCAERQVRAPSRQVGTPVVGDRIAQSARGQAPGWHPTTARGSQENLSPVRPVFRCVGSDPTAHRVPSHGKGGTRKEMLCPTHPQRLRRLFDKLAARL